MIHAQSFCLKIFLPVFFLYAITPICFSQTTDDYINGQLFVKIKDNRDFLSFENLGNLIENYDIQKISKPFILDDPKLQRTYLVKFNKSPKADELIKELQRLEFIEYAEKIPNYQLFLTPNDLHPNQWNLLKIQAELAWGIATGNAIIVIAMVDDAVLLSHEDLSPIIWINPGEIPGNGLDDDGNGYIDDINGWDAANNDNDPNPDNSTNSSFTHGTHTAGIAAAATDNGIGIASISYNVRLMAVKTAVDGSGSLPAAYLGVQYAIAAGADIISMSWGGGGFSQTYQNLFNTAHNSGIVLVAAAGNSNTTIPMYPASYNYVINVGATNSSDQKASFSNYGSTIDVMAPGQDIWSCLAGSNSSYGYLSGTSMACPLVSGLAALMLSRDPSLTPDDLESCLKSTCDNINAQNPSYIGQIGAGRINAYQALLCLKPINADFTSDYTRVCPGATVQFTDMSTNNPTSWQWSFPGGTPSSSTIQNPFVMYSAAGTYDVTLIATNTDGTDTIIKTNYITAALPSAIISGSATIIAGYSANLRVDLTGNPPWSITYSDSTNIYTINNITNSPYYITVSPDSTTFYTLISVNDNGCGGNVSGIAIITVTLSSSCYGATFQKVFLGIGKSFQQTADGGYIITGEMNSFGAGLGDVYLVKTNAAGDALWIKAYGGADWDAGFSVKQTTDEGYIIAGRTKSFGAGNYDVYLIKTNVNGDTLWTKTFGGTNLDMAFSVQQTFDEGYIITGYTLSYGAGSHDVFLIKTDINGNTLWTKTLGGFSSDIGYSIQQTIDSGYVITGSSASFGAGLLDVYVIKTDVNGDVIWTKTFGGADVDIGNSVRQTTDGGYIIVGETWSFGAGSEDVYLIRIDANGDTLWTKTYGGTDADVGRSVQQTNDGGFIITGNTLSFGAGGNEVYLIKTNANGDTLWTKIFGGTGGETGMTVEQTANGEYIIAGATNSFGTGGCYLIKTDSNGNSGCNQSPTATVVGNPSTMVSSGGTANNQTPIITNPATIVSDTIAIDSTLCSTPCDITPPPPCITTFQKTFGGTGNESGNSIQQTTDGGYIIAGQISSSGAGSSDVYLIKLNANSDILWTKAYGGSTTDIAYSVRQTVDGGYIITGGTVSFGAGNYDVYLIKTDANGDTLWTKTFGDTCGDIGYSVLQTSDGGFIIAGSTSSFGCGDIDVFLIRTDANGDTLWTKTYGGTGFEIGTSIQQTADGGFIITGGSTSFGAGTWDVYLIKTDSVGGLMWTKTFGGTEAEVGRAVLQTNDTGYIIVAETESFGVGGICGSNLCRDVYVIKTDQNGNLLWTKTYGGTGEDLGRAIQQTDDDGYIITGRTNSFGAGSDDVFLIRIDNNGDTLWTKSYGGVDSERAYSIIITADGGYMITGKTGSFGAGLLDVYLIRTDANGNSGCNQTGTNTVVGSPSTLVGSGGIVGSGAIVGNPATIVSNTATIDSVLCYNCDTVVAPPEPITPPYCNLQADFTADTICIGDSTSFIDLSTDSVTNIVIWRWYFGDGDSLFGVPNPKHLYGTADTFQVMLIVGNDSTPACFDTITKTVVVLDTLTLSALADTTICIGDSIALGPLSIICGVKPFTYSWTPGSMLSDSTAANPQTSPSVTTTYYIAVTDSMGVTATDSITIYVDTACCRSYARIGADASYCYRDSVSLTNNSAAKPGASYDWYFGPSASPGYYTGSNPPPVFFDTTGVIQVRLIINDSCGTDTGYRDVFIYPLPIAVAGNDTSVCINDTLQIGYTPLTYHSYLWTPNTGLSNDSIANPFAYIDSSITYMLTATDIISGCSATDTLTITVDTLIIVSISGDSVICYGDSIILIAIGNGNYSWSTGDTTQSITVSPSINTTYLATVTDTCGSSTDSIIVVVNPLPVVYAGKDDTIVLGSNVQLSASGALNYTWYPPAELSCTYCRFPVASPENTTTYYVIGINSEGCSAIDSVIITVDKEMVIFIPDIFSPNNDGNNDILYVRGKGIQSIYFAVYGRWGEKVFETTNIDIGWDGSFRGKPMNPAVFVYYVTGSFINGDKIDKKGNITLIR